MASEIISTSIDELSQIAIATALMVDKTLGVRLEDTITRRETGPGQISVRFPIWSAAGAASGWTEGEDISNTAETTSGVVLTPTTSAGVRHIISDLAAHNAPQVVADLARHMAIEIRMKKNNDIFALFDGFSTALGTTNVDITESLIRQGVKKIIQAGGNPMEIFLCMTPEVMEDFWTIYSTNTNNTSDRLRDAVMNGEMPMIYGVKPFVINGPTESGDLKCGLYTREALGYAGASGLDPKVEIARRAAGVGFDLVMSAHYAVGEIEDTFGVELLVDGAD